MIWMQRNAYEDSTTRKVADLLKRLKKNCNTNDAEEVKLYIARKKCSNAYKENLIEAYAIFMHSIKQEWDKPFYSRYDKKRRAPKEELINFLIVHAKFPMSLKLSMSKDLGQRPIELTWLKVQDIDLTSGNVSITGAKHTVGREGKLKPRTLELLKQYITTRRLHSESIIFEKMTSEAFGNCYRQTRKRMATRYNRPELKQIQLYDFRRWKGTRTYKLTRSILHTQQILGHSQNDIRATLKYITLEDDLGSWIPIKAITDEEKAECIANDYQLVANDNGIFWFKKPA
jgi:integrase